MKSVVLVKGKEGEHVEEGAEDVGPADNGGNLKTKKILINFLFYKTIVSYRFTVNRMGGKEGGSQQG